MRFWTGIPFLLLPFLFCGCASETGMVCETVRLAEPPGLPCRMRQRTDLIEISDCHLAFDLSDVPDVVGIPLMVHNPFDDRSARRSKNAICPIRNVLLRVFEDGEARTFHGKGTHGEATIRLSVHRIGMARYGTGVRIVLGCSAFCDNEKLDEFSIENVSPWENGQLVPSCAYAAAAALGDQIFDAIARSRRMKELIAATRSSEGVAPSVESWEFSPVDKNGFSGVLVLNPGTWDFGRIQLWVRSQLEQLAFARLGVRSLDNYRIVHLAESGNSRAGGKQRFRFRVFPYAGFDIPVYNPETRQGTCVVDIAYLGISENEGYHRAEAFLEKILAGQGVVRITGQQAPAAQYRFLGYRTTGNGTILEIPFELVE